MKINFFLGVALNALKSAVENTQQNYDEALKTSEQATTKETQAQNTLETASTSLTSFQERLDKLKAIKSENFTEENKKKLNDKITNLTKIVNEKRTAKEEAEKALTEATKAKEEAEKKLTEATKAKDEAKENLTKFEQELAEKYPQIKNLQEKWHNAQKARIDKKATLVATAQEELKTAQAKVAEIEKELAVRKDKEELKEFNTGVQYSQEEIDMMKAKGLKLATTQDGHQYFHTPWGRYRKGVVQDELLENLLLLNLYAKENGFILGFNDGERTNKESAWGRSQKGKLVCAPGNSPHNYGAAADLVLYDKNGKCLDFRKEGRQVAEYAKSLGLTWGGDWNKKNEHHHFEVAHWREKYKNLENHVETRAKNLNTLAA